MPSARHLLLRHYKNEKKFDSLNSILLILSKYNIFFLFFSNYFRKEKRSINFVTDLSNYLLSFSELDSFAKNKPIWNLFLFFKPEKSFQLFSFGFRFLTSMVKCNNNRKNKNCLSVDIKLSRLLQYRKRHPLR